MKVDNPIGLAGASGASSARVYLDDSTSRLLMIESDGRLNIVGDLANDGSAASIWTHTQDGPDGYLLRVNGRAAWEVQGDIEVVPDPLTEVTRIAIEHPIVFSASKAYAPAVPAGTKATVEASGCLTFRTVGAPLSGSVAVIFAADLGAVSAVPDVPQDGQIVAAIHADGAWHMRRSWVVLSRLHCNLLAGYDFSVGAPGTQTLGFDGSALAYRSAAGATWALSP